MIRDAMAENHLLAIDCPTFGDLAHGYTSRLVQCTLEAATVVDVFDQCYHDNSVKGDERNRRLAAASGARRYQVIAGRPLLPLQM